MGWSANSKKNKRNCQDVQWYQILIDVMTNRNIRSVRVKLIRVWREECVSSLRVGRFDSFGVTVNMMSDRSSFACRVECVWSLSVRYVFTHDETQLLARELSFCHTPRHINWTEIKAHFSEFSRRMRLLEYFHDYPPQANPNPFRPKSTRTPPPYREIALEIALDTFLNAVEHDARNIKPEPVRDNLTSGERHALRSLNKHNIVIKSANKGYDTFIHKRHYTLS